MPLINIPTVGEVNFPDGMSDDAISAAIQKNYPQLSKPAPSSNTDVAINAANKGIASLPDAILNTPNNLLNLGKAAVGTIAGMAGRPDLMPNITENPDLARRGMTAVGAINPNIQPQGFVQKAIDYGVQGAVGGALTGGGGLARTAVGAGLGALSGEAAGATAEMGGSPAAVATAGMLAPTAAARAPAAMDASARYLMQSALKPTWADNRSGRGDRAVNTLLEEGVNPTRGGVHHLNTMIADLGNQVSGLLQQYSGTTVDKNAVASRIQDVVDRINTTNPTPQTALQAVHNVYNDFIGNGLVPRNIPVQDANRLKSGIYQAIRNSYGQLSGDHVEAQKALARGFKEEINAAVPEVVPLNARQGDLINARNVAERRALMEGNKNPAGLALLAHDPMAMLGHWASGSALAKSLAARALYSGHGDERTGILSQVSNQTSPIVTQGILADIHRRQQ